MEILQKLRIAACVKKPSGQMRKKVRHHEHFYTPTSESNSQSPNMSGNFKEACHIRFNLLAKKACFVSCIFHNTKHFDGHILMQSLGHLKTSEMKCIAANLKNYISFSDDNLRFIDSFQFFNSSSENVIESQW